MTDIYKLSVKYVVFILLGLALCRLSQSYFLYVVTLIGIVSAISGKLGRAFSCWLFLQFSFFVNQAIVPIEGILISLIIRGGPLCIAILLALYGAKTLSHFRVPLGFLYVYILVAAFSSIEGWAPVISFLKLIQFVIFLTGLYFGMPALRSKPEFLIQVRAFFLALIFVIVVGSILVMPIPEISYSTSLRNVADDGVASMRALYEQMRFSGGMVLFSGIMNHSQALAPTLGISYAWILCDMLFIERGFRWVHSILLTAIVPMIYMTRSRLGLLILCVTSVFVYFYTSRSVSLPRRIRQMLGRGMLMMFVFMVGGACVMEVNTRSITKWLRKTNMVETDQRELGEAFTGSRQGAIERGVSDFNRNQLLGSGFQVAEEIAHLYRRSNGLILSASVEKGLLPLIVLGETGVIGSCVFLIFLLMFYFGCVKRSLFVTLTMFVVFLTINMGEGTFFSPGGIGGMQWLMCMLGGYTIDILNQITMRRF